ncbi:efflux RND transporter periplasmic adaptor subunit [Chitinophaga pendula]|uniref:efflux RND transporter periplasmic adaptor subunit n=1 Tax=Chitinophaga TaxID=79328 RepID=UPI000BAF74D9|nr:MULTISPECIES: efflux RND transporter periplasmic adaptor subunit [Chitinophaga]ASZ15043.1 efflux transporter periplasmic adaptor subunit [Chitinophaga sp. MD30]UCJ09009.1 efflux RND transporter periplasmic adaptor subunit [Chitinophaga pendula]
MRTKHWIYAPVLATALAGCATKGGPNTKEAPKTLPVTSLSVTDTVLHRNYVTDIQAVQNVEIRARVKGFLDKIHIDEGAFVKRGQLLFSLNADEYRAALAQAKANLSSAIAEAKAAELEAGRVKLLVDKKVITKSELEVAAARVAAANARVDEASSTVDNAAMRLAYTSIRSPFDGVIDRLPLKPGSLIDEGSLLTSVSDTKDVYAYFNVSETEYLEYTRSRDQHRGPRTVSLLLADGTAYPYPGKVETIEGEFEENTGSIAFRARFPNPDKLLKHGASGKVSLSNDLDSALLIPQKAVFEMQDQHYVFLVDKHNKVKLHPFVPGPRIAHFYVAKSGLRAGDRIVCEGVLNIRDGMEIKPSMMPIDSLARL